MSDRHLRRTRNASTDTKIPAAKNTQHRVILILGVLLILTFITLVILTSFLFISNRIIGEEMSQMRNGNSSCCPEGWIPIGSKCYYFQNTTETWERSREECTKNYSVLLILKNKDELDSLLPFMEGDRYWIGLRRDTQNSTRWVWVDGTPLTFSAWNKGEPNNQYGRENCTEIKKNVRSMNDVPCDIKKHYICKALSRG
ncbi:CD209 antigen-like protein C [Rana temporaria]|uniref:CD209 antigen-like protein C n=1 Tax=Rana temporaria TaxID=8407 RepID=UPI001AAD8D7E|nr:CD209 antigen-like protein C [Rana temporaria]